MAFFRCKNSVNVKRDQYLVKGKLTPLKGQRTSFYEEDLASK